MQWGQWKHEALRILKAVLHWAIEFALMSPPYLNKKQS